MKVFFKPFKNQFTIHIDKSKKYITIEKFLKKIYGIKKTNLGYLLSIINISKQDLCKQNSSFLYKKLLYSLNRFLFIKKLVNKQSKLIQFN